MKPACMASFLPYDSACPHLQFSPYVSAYVSAPGRLLQNAGWLKQRNCMFSAWSVKVSICLSSEACVLGLQIATTYFLIVSTSSSHKSLSYALGLPCFETWSLCAVQAGLDLSSSSSLLAPVL